MDKSAEATPNLSIPKPKYAVRFITINGRDYLHRLWKSLTTDLTFYISGWVNRLRLNGSVAGYRSESTSHLNTVG